MTILAELLRQHEGKTLEFKRDVSSPDNLVRTVVAFANGAGGTLLIGVEDGTRQVRGLTDPTKVEERLANLISDRIEPRLVPELQVIPWRKTYVIAVGVFPSSSRPHFVKTQGSEDGVYVRVGSTNRRADPAQIEEIRRFVRGRTLDEEALPDESAGVLDFRAASACFAPIRRLRRSDLRTLHLTTTHQNREVPTAGGLLLFGKNRLAVFPEAFIRAGCFAGTDRTSILDSADITTYLPLAVEEALLFIKRNTRRALTIESARHVDTWEFPLVAAREAVINSLVHADYGQRGTPLRIAIFSDRLEIDNPGGLPPGLTVEDILRGVSKLRNRVIGRVFHELGLIEQWGSGIQRMIAACSQAGLAEPSFEELSSGFRVTFRRDWMSAPRLDPIDQAILKFVRQSGNASTSQIAAHIRRTPRATRDRLNRLVDAGLLVAVASGPKDPRKTFSLLRR
jgi:predicted HTH transcriptional regulator